jgi:RTX calcium-binding nonapeptide repeat (4 copies)/WD40-like Beta Propeller Repeat
VPHRAPRLARPRQYRGWAAFALPLAVVAIASPAYGGAFPGANGKIAFSRDVSGVPGGADLYAVNPDGTDLTQLTSSGGADDLGPAFSPDGTSITFARSANIYVADSDGSNLHQVTSAGKDRDPEFSPGGNQIVFSRVIRTSPPPASTPGYGVFVMNSDGSSVEQLTDPPADPYGQPLSDLEPTYSPSGEKIAFTRMDIESPFVVPAQVFIMDADGSNETQFTHLQQASWPSFSPDGAQIAFAGQRGTNLDIFVMNSDGTNPMDLTNDPAVDDQPAFSPDGKSIAFRRQFSIYTFSLGGGGEHQLTSGNTDSMPAWQPVLGLGGVPTCAGHPANVVGTAHGDRLTGTRGPDVVVAMGGNDRIKVGAGRDLVCAGHGVDRVRGRKAADRLFGAGGGDRLRGGPGPDLLRGRRGRDRLWGGGGADRLAGGRGRDRCRGGAGADVVHRC